MAQYIWSTSPLRRYVDLINQRQLVAVARGEKPPYAANDADLFAILSAFDARHEAYGQIQTQMERYWCLRWLHQENKTRVEAVVVREDLLRLAEAPFYFRVPDVPSLASGRRVLVDILSRDELALELSARFVEALAGDAPVPPEDEVFAEENAEDAAESAAEDAAENTAENTAGGAVPDGPAAGASSLDGSAANEPVADPSLVRATVASALAEPPPAAGG